MNRREFLKNAFCGSAMVMLPSVDLVKEGVGVKCEDRKVESWRTSYEVFDYHLERIPEHNPILRLTRQGHFHASGPEASKAIFTGPDWFAPHGEMAMIDSAYVSPERKFPDNCIEREWKYEYVFPIYVSEWEFENFGTMMSPNGPSGLIIVTKPTLPDGWVRLTEQVKSNLKATWNGRGAVIEQQKHPIITVITRDVKYA